MSQAAGNPVWVVMRSRNDIALVGKTIRGVRAQSMRCRLLVLDNASSDGTREEAARYADRVIDIPEGAYIPGRVLNRAMEETDGEVVVFLNSDCEPENDRWLAPLVAGMGEKSMGEGKTEAACIAACFGRQDPRPDASPLMAKDTLFTFGDGARQARWIHCFSMASSCIRRSVWQTMRFSETLKYSEDIDWTWRARQAGCRIVYRPGSAVFHSHNYTLRQLHKRQFGEGYAEAEIFDLPEARRGFFRYSLLPWGRLVFSDIAWCVPRGKIGAAFFSPVARAVMSAGRLKGFKTAVASKSGAAQSRVVKSGEAKSDVGGKVSGGPQ